MKLKYEGAKRFLILYPENHLVEKGYEIETTDKQFIKDLKELGFKEVKAKNKEGEK
jgi:endonuclease I